MIFKKYIDMLMVRVTVDWDFVLKKKKILG